MGINKLQVSVARIRVILSVNKNIFYTFLTQIPTLFLGIVTGVFITRILGPEGRGVYTVFQANIELFTLFLGFSLNSAFVYYISSRKIKIEKLMGIGILLLLTSSLIFLLILTIIKSFFVDSFVFPASYNSSYYFLYLLLSFIATSFNGLVVAVFHGKSVFKVVNMIAVFNSVFNVLLFSGMYIFFIYSPNTISVKEVLLVSLTVLALNSIIGGLLYMKLIKIPPSFDFSIKEDIKPLFSFVFLSHVGHVINFLNYRLDIWIIGYYKGTEELGYYSLAVNVAQMFWLISNPIVMVLTPYLVQKKGTERDEIYKFFSKLNFTSILLLMIVAFAVSDFLLPFIYGEEFGKSVLPFRIMLSGVLFSCITKVFAAYIYSQNKIQYNLIATIAGLLITVIFDFMLIPRYGIIGASITSGITYFTILLTVTLFLFIKMDMPFKNYYLLSYKDIKQITGKFKKISQL